MFKMVDFLLCIFCPLKKKKKPMRVALTASTMGATRKRWLWAEVVESHRAGGGLRRVLETGRAWEHRGGRWVGVGRAHGREIPSGQKSIQRQELAGWRLGGGRGPPAHQSR